ncbi:MAG: CDP-alcohol phosphatidyltransferase family protein [Actinomycetota bacterium]
MSRQAYFDAWAHNHGVDIRRIPLVRSWLRVVYFSSLPLARCHISPAAVTSAGFALAWVVPLLVSQGERWVLLAVPVMALAGFLDNVDGALAVITHRSSRWGALLDAVVDRLADTAGVAALWVLGAPGWSAVCAGGVFGLHEYIRAKAGELGLNGVGTVTIAERPTRVIAMVMFLFGAGIFPEFTQKWATGGVIFCCLVGIFGLIHLLLVVHRDLQQRLP